MKLTNMRLALSVTAFFFFACGDGEATIPDDTENGEPESGTDTDSVAEEDEDSDTGTGSAAEEDATCDLAVAHYEACDVDSGNQDRMSDCCDVADLLFADIVAQDLYTCIVDTPCDTLTESPVGIRTECLFSMVDTITPTDAHIALAEAQCSHDQDLCDGGDYDGCVDSYFEESEDAMITLWLKEEIVEDMAECFTGFTECNEDASDLCFDEIIYAVADGEVCWGGDEDVVTPCRSEGGAGHFYCADITDEDVCDYVVGLCEAEGNLDDCCLWDPEEGSCGANAEDLPCHMIDDQDICDEISPECYWED
jgi:hypothetical protein